MSEQKISMNRDELYKQITKDLQSGKYVSVEQLCIKLLAQYKRSPQLWVFLGEALFHQGYLSLAERIFKRALLLDPQAGWEKTIFAEVDKRSNEAETIEVPREDIEQLLDVAPVTVSAAIIVKNEERSIIRCIESIKNAVDEIIVLDTGSTDRTVELLQRYPEVKVYYESWQHDFAAARNAAMKHVTSDWVMWIDADEHLHSEDVSAIKETAGLFNSHSVPAAYLVGHMNPPYEEETATYSVVRLFAMRHQLRFWGRVHEQVGGKDGLFTTKLSGQAVRIRLLHDGYEPALIRAKRKLERNLSLLQAMLKDDPDNPAILANFGREILATGNIDRALPLLLEAEKKTKDHKRYARMPDIQMNLVKIYLSKNNLVAAEQVCRRAMEAEPNFPDSYYWLGHIQWLRAQQQIQKMNLGVRQDLLEG